MKKPTIVSQKLWNKLTENQQKHWIKFYKDFYNELQILSSEQNKVSSYNLAFKAIEVID